MTRNPARIFPAALLALTFATPALATEWEPHALVDLTLASGAESHQLNLFSQGDSNFDPYRVRVTVEGELSDYLEVYLESILHEGTANVRADGAYAQWTPWPKRDFHVQAGKISWPIGGWAPRATSKDNPLIGAPLMYQYHTALASDAMPASIDQLVASAGSGQLGLGDGSSPGHGMPVVDDRWWDFGIVALGSQRPWEFALGTTQGTPGWPMPGRDETPGQTLLGRVGLAPTAGVRVGVSGARGNWLYEDFTSDLPAGRSMHDYHEWLAMSDVELSRGHCELRAEGFLKGWETIAIGELRLRGGYAEARLGLCANSWVAARWETMRFADVRTSTGVVRPWDDDIDRFEAGVGYRVSKDVRLKAALQRNVQHPFGQKTEASDLFALSTSIGL